MIPLNDSELAMVGEFQCPGCVCGSAPAIGCSSFKPSKEPGAGAACTAHCSGTSIGGLGMAARVYLGLPKGFNKVGSIPKPPDSLSHNNIRLWDEGTPKWDHLNVPVWARVDDGYLFVRTFCPRIGVHYIDVVKGGTWDLVAEFHPQNVNDFVDTID